MTKAITAALIGLLFVAGIVGTSLYQDSQRDKQTEGLIKLESYKHYGNAPSLVRCLANSPECGVCPGEVIDKECYVEPDSYWGLEEQRKSIIP